MNPLFENLIKSYIPELKKNAAPVIEDKLAQIIEENNRNKMENETEAVIVVAKDNNNHCPVMICFLDDQNKITRIAKNANINELFESLFSKL